MTWSIDHKCTQCISSSAKTLQNCCKIKCHNMQIQSYVINIALVFSFQSSSIDHTIDNILAKTLIDYEVLWVRSLIGGSMNKSNWNSNNVMILSVVVIKLQILHKLMTNRVARECYYIHVWIKMCTCQFKLMIVMLTISLGTILK